MRSATAPTRSANWSRPYSEKNAPCRARFKASLGGLSAIRYRRIARPPFRPGLFRPFPAPGTSRNACAFPRQRAGPSARRTIQGICGKKVAGLVSNYLYMMLINIVFLYQLKSCPTFCPTLLGRHRAISDKIALAWREYWLVKSAKLPSPNGNAMQVRRSNLARNWSRTAGAGLHTVRNPAAQRICNYLKND